MYSKQMHLNKTSRVAGPGSRGQTNNGDLYQKPGRNVKAVSRLQIDPGGNDFEYSQSKLLEKSNIKETGEIK